MSPALLRIVWKEYRTQRAFWVSIVAAITLIDLALVADPWLAKSDRPAALFGVALMLAALYVLGSATTLFATERENGTYELLRCLPVGPWKVFIGKTAFAVLSTAAMFFFASALARILAGELPAMRGSDAWFYLGLDIVELFAFPILFSLLLRRTLVAAILAGSVLAFLETSFKTASSLRLLIVSLVMLVNLIVANYWLREKLLPFAVGTRRVSHGGGPLSGRNLGRLGRLVWQDMRQSTVLTLSLLAVLLPATLFFWLEWLGRTAVIDRWTSSNILFPICSALVMAGWLSPVLVASTVFLGDQTGYHFRFLGERGLPPRTVWLSRHIRGLLVMLLGLLLILPAILLNAKGKPVVEEPAFAANLFGYLATSYACGQLCSMTFRSGIFAVAFGGFSTAAVCIWAWFVHKFGMSWSWTVAPLLLSFLAATWLHVPDWLAERKTWRVRLWPILVIVIPAVAILAALPMVRIYEIPSVDPGFDPKGVSWPISPEENDVLTFYRRFNEFHRNMEGTEREIDSPELEISLARTIASIGNSLQSKGRLEEAADHYLHAMRVIQHVRQLYPWSLAAYKKEMQLCEDFIYWAAAHGQTSERVLKARRALEELWRTPPTFCDELEYVYSRAHRILEGEIDEQAAKDVKVQDFQWIARWLPWERARALRILNLLTAERMAWCREAEAAMAAGDFMPRILTPKYARKLESDMATYDVVVRNLPPFIPDDYLMVENCRRATQLVLALEAWKIDHGALPGSLDELQNKYIDRVPVDPTTGEKFGYEPEGTDDPRSAYVGFTSTEIKPGEPFVGGPPKRPGQVKAYLDGETSGLRFSRGWVFPFHEAMS